MTGGAAFDTLERIRGRREGAWRPVALALAIVVAAVGLGHMRMRQIDARRASAPGLRVGLVQGNVGIDEKGDPGRAAAELALYQEQTRDL